MGFSGSGLGLSIVWNTMLDHGGTVTVENRAPGTKFTLYFPADDQNAEEEQKNGSTLSDLTGHGEHILVVDDDKNLLEIANQMLSKAHEEVDPLYWPAYVAEAELLWARGNPQQAIEACAEAASAFSISSWLFPGTWHKSPQRVRILSLCG